MPKQDKPRDVDKLTGQKKNIYEVIKGSGGKGSDGENVPKCACDRKRCLNGRCGVWWMIIVGLSITLVVFLICYVCGVLGFDFDTDGTDTLYEEICDSCTDEPTTEPTLSPTADPTLAPSIGPSVEPTSNPTSDPTTNPTDIPTTEPSFAPSSDPTVDPSPMPSVDPTEVPTTDPSVEPTAAPSSTPTLWPSNAPTSDPTVIPTGLPSTEPTKTPTADPTTEPTSAPVQPTSEPTTSPTDEPTADPTSERRRMSNNDMNPNVLLILAEGTGFDYSEFETPEVDEFFTEGYTFKNVKQPLRGNLMTGKSASEITWAQGMRSKGYTNYYYGNWILDTGSRKSTPIERGWDFFYGTAMDEPRIGDDLIMEKVQSRINVVKDEKWTITVNWTSTESYTNFQMNVTNPEVFDACRRYFKVGGTNFNYHHGLRCQWTLEHDAMFGKILKTLKSNDLWMRTIVVFVHAGQQNIFSISGGALPANLLNRTNEDRHSMLDVVPTILAVGGFSDLELARVNFDGFAVFRINQNHI